MHHFAKNLRYDYRATCEWSQWFDGYRAVVRHKVNGTDMYYGQHIYRSALQAKEAAALYLNTYAERGDKAASEAVSVYAVKHAIDKSTNGAV